MGPASARKVINLEEVEDEVLDVRTARRWRRRCIANGIYKPDCGRSTTKKGTKCNTEVENRMWDKDYEKCLYLIEDGGDRNEHSSDHDIDIRQSVDDCDRWNEHNGDGNRHSSGENIDIRSVDDVGNEHSDDDNNDVRAVDDIGNEHSANDNVAMKSVDDGDDRNEQCGDDNVNMKSVDDGDCGNVHSADGNTKISSIDDSDGNIHTDSLNDGLDDDDDMDPHYKFFWDNLREDGNSYALEMVQEDGSLKQIRYHQDDGLPDELNLDTMPQLKETTEIKSRVTLENLEDAPKKKSSVVKRNLKLEAPEPVSDGTNVRSSKRPRLEVPNTPESLRSSPLKEKTETRRTSRLVMKKGNLEDHPEKNSSKVKKHVKVVDADPLSGRTNGRSNKPGSKNLRFSEGGRNSEAESDSNVTDDNYQEFLSRTRDDGKIVVFKPKNCEPIIYDADEESSSDSDVIVLDRDPNEGYRTPIKIDVDSGQCTESHSQFRQGIMKDLKRPYDLEEYLNLLEDWSRQRPPTSHDRNLRNGKIKSYSLPGEFGRSYQEMYKDLAVKIDAAGDDRPRKLNLLRGFFYWLKNVTKEGSFKPWNDKACLRVLPQKR